MQLTPYLHIGTGVTVYIEGDPAVPDFRITGSPFEARTAPFDEDKPKLKQALKEAKKRNPDIKLYGLPWAFPQHVSCAPGTLEDCTNNPYDRPQQTADYIVNWVKGAQTEHGLTIDYLGSWNE